MDNIGNSLIKLLLENINNNIETLRKENNIKIEEIKTKVNQLSSKIDDIKFNYVHEEDCKEKRELLKASEENNVRKEELSLKKITIITGTISAGIASIITIVSKVVK